jgi:putative hemolysin
LCDGTIDRVIGVVLARDLLAETWSDQPIDLRALARQPLFLPDTMPAPRALERFKQTGIHTALLVDEFGGIDGLVTIIDMMEAIVGDMPSVSDIAEPPVVRREDGSWLVDGLLDVDDLKMLLGTAQMPDEEDYQTLGGFVVTRLGRLPRAGDTYVWGGFRFEVMDMDGNRVDKVLIRVA